MNNQPCLAAIILFFFTTAGAAQEIERGVSFELSRQRKRDISNLEYQLYFSIQESGPVHARVRIHFDWKPSSAPLIIDFNAPIDHLKQARLNSNVIMPEMRAGHVVIPAESMSSGRQQIDIEFIAGDRSLNRSDEFLYTLLVPDRASTVFPCFDQPDLKAQFSLTLDIPNGWIASANGTIDKKIDVLPNSKQTRLVFSETRPISTYLFAFAAGEFEQLTREIDGRTLTMLHRESDQEKVERNIDQIFEIHAMSLNWMENYTGIEYPFQKFSFVLIPSFQYGGMEHIGNIFYNADQLLLDPTATKNQKLSRASLIAHETAHMWFGNLVTMKWFDDVWLKEVFANFMAAKIVHPGFPEINHDLNFMMKHHPSAYGEDRTAGTYPIQQDLDNLQNAGTLYGRIIYQKAPVVMRQLETLIGQSELQSGLQEYLSQFSYSNAVWDDLIDILDRKTEIDLHQWSAAWVKESGTPEINSQLRESKLVIQQTRKTEQNRYWEQQVDIKVVAQGKTAHQVRALINGESTEVIIPALEEYDFYLTNGSELGYGYFRLDKKSQEYLLSNINGVKDDVTRGAAWLALYESLIRGDLNKERFINTLLQGVVAESEPLNRQNILAQLGVVFWKFLSPEQRSKVAPEFEIALWKFIDDEQLDKEAKSTYYKALVNIATTQSTIDRLFTIFDTEGNQGLGGAGGLEPSCLELSENDFITLAYELAVRLPDRANTILDRQFARLANEDRRKRFLFVRSALAKDQAQRDRFFDSLKDADNRRPERWTLEALGYLHHPLRARESEKYILPSLELLEEIQLTGDIFFPKRWLVATFRGHQSKSAAQVVSDFLSQRPDYPKRLTNKILQAADLLFKVAALPTTPSNNESIGGKKG